MDFERRTNDDLKTWVVRAANCLCGTKAQWNWFPLTFFPNELLLLRQINGLQLTHWIKWCHLKMGEAAAAPAMEGECFFVFRIFPVNDQMRLWFFIAFTRSLSCLIFVWENRCASLINDSRLWHQIKRFSTLNPLRAHWSWIGWMAERVNYTQQHGTIGGSIESFLGSVFL